MANRFWNLPSFQLETGVVRLYAYITFGASGAPTLVTTKSKGFASVVKTGTGLYTLTFGTIRPGQNNAVDTYFRTLDMDVLWDATGNSGTAPAAPLVYLVASHPGTTGTIEIATQNMSQVDTSPASGEALYVKLTMSNSNNVS